MVSQAQGQGPPNPHGGSRPISPSLLRSNSSLLGGQRGGISSHNASPPLVSLQNQFNMKMIGTGWGGYADGSVRIWDSEKGTCETTLNGHKGTLTVIRYSL
ncbi:unnamed protein product [Fraxinus pennsylvanica]|uniref:Uncharacterized protein n=1 Tax=Fraxinus pennsylvanica TaxID=56036 RepID=A0AAD1YXZ0_9LAMI|nr:unnamed protein product [Fraxinus pennsylvanica]